MSLSSVIVSSLILYIPDISNLLSLINVFLVFNFVLPKLFTSADATFNTSGLFVVFCSSFNAPFKSPFFICSLTTGLIRSSKPSTADTSKNSFSAAAILRSAAEDSSASKLRVGLFSINSIYSASDRLAVLNLPSFANLFISLVDIFRKPDKDGVIFLSFISAIFLAFFASLFLKFCLKAASGLFTTSESCVCTKLFASSSVFSASFSVFF